MYCARRSLPGGGYVIPSGMLAAGMCAAVFGCGSSQRRTGRLPSRAVAQHTEETVLAALGSNDPKRVAAVLPFLVETRWFERPAGDGRPRRKLDAEAIRALVRIGRESLPVLVQALRASAASPESLSPFVFDAMTELDPEGKTLFSWAESAEHPFRQRWIRRLATSLLAADAQRAAPLILSALDDKVEAGVTWGGQPLRWCDLLARKIAGAFSVRRILSYPDADPAVTRARLDEDIDGVRRWLARESAPDGAIGRLVWLGLRPVGPGEEGLLLVGVRRYHGSAMLRPFGTLTPEGGSGWGLGGGASRTGWTPVPLWIPLATHGPCRMHLRYSTTLPDGRVLRYEGVATVKPGEKNLLPLREEAE